MGDASREIMRQARKQVPEWTPAEANEALAQQRKGEQDGIVLVDVREKNEWDEGYIPGALHIPRGFLELRVEEAIPDKSQKVVLYCAGGTRSMYAGLTLKQMGYEDVISMSGGFGQWKSSGLPVKTPRTLSQEQLKRYSRHLLIPEVGEQGQLKLLDSRVLLLGAGGLGAPAEVTRRGAARGRSLFPRQLGGVAAHRSELVPLPGRGRSQLAAMGRKARRRGRPSDVVLTRSAQVLLG